MSVKFQVSLSELSLRQQDPLEIVSNSCTRYINANLEDSGLNLKDAFRQLEVVLVQCSLATSIINDSVAVLGCKPKIGDAKR